MRVNRQGAARDGGQLAELKRVSVWIDPHAQVRALARARATTRLWLGSTVRLGAGAIKGTEAVQRAAADAAVVDLTD